MHLELILQPAALLRPKKVFITCVALYPFALYYTLTLFVEIFVAEGIPENGMDVVLSCTFQSTFKLHLEGLYPCETFDNRHKWQKSLETHGMEFDPFHGMQNSKNFDGVPI